MPLCPTIQIRRRKLFASGTHTLSINIKTPSHLVIPRLQWEDCSWHWCISNIEGQVHFKYWRPWNTWVFIWQACLPKDFLPQVGAQWHSKIFEALKPNGTAYPRSDSLRVESKRKMRFGRSMSNRKWFSLRRKCQSLSSDSMTGNASFSITLQRCWVAFNDPFKMAKARAPDHAHWPSPASLEPELRLVPNQRDRVSDKLVNRAESSVMVGHAGISI